jgi:hypothetical protein
MLAPFDPNTRWSEFRALSGRLKMTVRRHECNQDFISTRTPEFEGSSGPDGGGWYHMDQVEVGHTTCRSSQGHQARPARQSPPPPRGVPRSRRRSLARPALTRPAEGTPAPG